MRRTMSRRSRRFGELVNVLHRATSPEDYGATAGWRLDVRAIIRRVVRDHMRFIHLYLIGYFI
jgi:hypothetical protein